MVYSTGVETGEAHELNALRLNSAPRLVFQSGRSRLEAHWFEIYHESVRYLTLLYLGALCT